MWSLRKYITLNEVTFNIVAYRLLVWAVTSENVLRTYAPCEDSDQRAHSRSLIRIFTCHILDSQGCKDFFMRTTKTLIRLRRSAA